MGPCAPLSEEKQFRQLLRQLHRQDWVVYAKPAFGGARQVLRYLGRYTHRVAISNHRLLVFDGERVTFRWNMLDARICPAASLVWVDLGNLRERRARKAPHIV